MTKTATLEQVIEHVNTVSANHFDEVVPVTEMEFDSLKRMWVSGKQVEVAPTAQRLFANRLGVPFSYLVRCPQDLQARNLNFWLEQQARNRDALFCRFDGNRMRAVFTERYTPLDNRQVLNRMIRHGFDPGTKVQYAYDEKIFSLKVPDWNRTFALKGNDRIVPGLSFTNSEVGVLAFSIEAFFLRLVCTNGLVSETKENLRFRHTSLRALEQFHEVIGNVSRAIGTKRDQLAFSMESRVENPAGSINSFGLRFGLTQDETKLVQEAYYLEPGYSMFHVVNAFTRAAQNRNLEPVDSYKLEKVGGQVLSLVRTAR